MGQGAAVVAGLGGGGGECVQVHYQQTVRIPCEASVLPIKQCG
jgi:hypothetical protein